MEDKEDDKKQGSCEQRWSHKFVNDTWPREKRRQPKVRGTTLNFSQARLMTKTSVFPIDIFWKTNFILGVAKTLFQHLGLFPYLDQ